MRCAWLVLLGACSFAPNRLTADAPADTAPPGEGTTGSDGSNSTGPACYGTGVVQICPAAPPSGTLTLSGTLDTATASACKAYSVAQGQPALDGLSPSASVSTPERTPISLAEARARRVSGRTRSAPSPVSPAGRVPTPISGSDLAALPHDESANG